MFTKEIVRRALFLTGFGLGACSLTACSGGANSWLSGASVSTFQVNGDSVVTVTTNLSTGSIGLLPVVLPIFNPNNQSQIIGELSILSAIGGGANELALSLDINEALSAGGIPSIGMLPNGTTIPVSGINSLNWVTLPISNGTGTANGKSLLYLNYDSFNHKAIVGVAVNINQLAVGAPSDLFLPFTYNSISGVAGIYTGAQPQESGFGLFIDVTSTMAAKTASQKVSGKVSFHATSRNAVKIQQKVFELESASAALKVR